MEDWQKDIMDAIKNNRWQAESNIEEPRAKVKAIPTNDIDFIMDIVYFAARKLKGKRLTPEHEELFNEYDDVLRNQGMKGFHDANVQTHANVRDEDTDERDEKYYPNDRLHEIRKSWTELLKAPFPNHRLNRQRGKHPELKGTGKGGLFKYDEIDQILNANITSLIDSRYEQEIEKKTRESIKEAKKTLKSQNKEFSPELENYITRRVEKTLTNQKLNNLYATAYGDYANPMSGSKGKWFSGGLSALGYNPEDNEQMSYVLRRISGLGNKYFHNWGSKKEEDDDDKVVKTWISIIRKRLSKDEMNESLEESTRKFPFVSDYRYGRCQVYEGTGCIRNLQSPQRREYAGSRPQGKICMFCEDDSYKWADLPEEIWRSEQYHKADLAKQKEMLDKYVKKHPKYNMRNFKPSR